MPNTAAAPVRSITCGSKTSSDMIHDFITDLASDRLPAKEFTFNSMRSANDKVKRILNSEIDRTDEEARKDPEVSRA